MPYIYMYPSVVLVCVVCVYNVSVLDALNCSSFTPSNTTRSVCSAYLVCEIL